MLRVEYDYEGKTAMQNRESLFNAELIRELQEIRNSISSLDQKILDTKTSLQDEIHSIKSEILEFQLKTQKLEDIHTWSKEFQQKITLSEIERLRIDVSNLKEYKTRAAVIFGVIQFGMGGLMAYMLK